jgi:hypothetical protein
MTSAVPHVIRSAGRFQAMNACQTLRQEATLSYKLLTDTLSEISEPLAWAQIQVVPPAYLHTNGTILAIVQHIAVCKFMYGSVAFRSTEIRWRDCFERLDGIGTSWAATKAYMDEAHDYWMSSWSALKDEELEHDKLRFDHALRPAWKLIATVTHHDGWHGGQVALLSSFLAPTDQPPDLKLEEERSYVKDLPTW